MTVKDEIDRRRRQYHQDIEICIRSMMYTFKKMSRKEAEKECRKYIKISLDLYAKRV